MLRHFARPEARSEGIKYDGSEARVFFQSLTMQSNYEETNKHATVLGSEEGIAGLTDRDCAQKTVKQEATPTSPSSSSDSPTTEGSKAQRDVPNDGKPQAYKSFDDMGLREGLLRGIYACGYEMPSVIQQRAIVPCCSGRDVIAQAQSGTGKTATFSIALIQQLDLSEIYCQVMLRVLELLIAQCRESHHYCMYDAIICSILTQANNIIMRIHA